MHNYSEIDRAVLPIRKKKDWFLNGFSHDDFDTNVVGPNIYFLVYFYSCVYVLFDRHVRYAL